MALTVINTILILGALNGLLAIFLVIAEYFFANYGDCVIKVNQEKEINVTGGQTLLVSLKTEKIYLPSACGGRGTCAYCKCRVTEGAGPVLPTEEALLSKDEIENQTRLACQVKVRQDMGVLIPEELFNIKAFKSRIRLIEDLTHDIKLLKLELMEPSEILFKAGQYVQLQSEPYNGVKESVSRAYSISSSCEQKNYIDLMIRLVPEGVCSTWVHQFLKTDDQVAFIGPMGDFYLREGEGEIIFIAGGSGMAPIVSLLHRMQEKKIARKATYFFGAVAKRDLFYENEMKYFEDALHDFTFVPALSRPEPEDQWNGKTGLITEPLLEYTTTIDTASAQAYLCGSPGMIHACCKVLEENGVKSENIFYDPFS